MSRTHDCIETIAFRVAVRFRSQMDDGEQYARLAEFPVQARAERTSCHSAPEPVLNALAAC
ncbi:MAG TPA: hypothetical protein VLC91_13870 [Spongiibacteraceae bacterium]|nr:hypothetical protein [Spongiibacteraceae bacterium]